MDATKSIFSEIFLDLQVLDFTDIEDGKFLIKSRRMIKETAISEARSESGKKGAEVKIKQTLSKTQAKPQQNNDIDIENNTNELFIISGDFKKIFDRWLNYKKSRGEKYKSSDSVQTALKNLHKLSGGDIVTAEQIIEQSIGNNWAGLFELKSKPETKKGGFVA
jgi:hypothetical protein